MSKYVKNLISSDIKGRLAGVNDAVVANVIGLDSDATYRIRKQLREKGVSVLVVKRSLANRAITDSNLARIFDNQDGSVAVLWGAEDFVSLSKIVADLVKSKHFEKFELKGGVMDGDALTAAKVLEISKWPSRQEQISLLVGQILGPGSQLSAQLLGAGSKVAGQVKKIIENKEGEA